MRVPYIYGLLLVGCICGLYFKPFQFSAEYMNLITRTMSEIPVSSTVSGDRYFTSNATDIHELRTDADMKTYPMDPPDIMNDNSRDHLGSNDIKVSISSPMINTYYDNANEALGFKTDTYQITSSFEKSQSTHNECNTLTEEITVVTAFFYLAESLRKGKENRKTEVYFEWMKIFELIENPVVAYFNRIEDSSYFEKMRPKSSGKNTRLTIRNPREMWAFQLQDRLRRRNNSTERTHNIMHDYYCVQHAKYELLLETSLLNPFCSRYIMWLDIGLFRDLVESNSTEPLSLWLPVGYDPTCVAYSRVRVRSLSADPGHIIRYGGRWLAGGAALANVELMYVWAKCYMEYTESVIEKYGILVSDQEVLYSWMNTNSTPAPVQEFRSRRRGGMWFALGYHCRNAGLARNSKKPYLNLLMKKVQK